MNKRPSLALSALAVALTLSGNAHAVLSAVDTGPYTAATGRFPAWYQDSTNLQLELCQSKALSSRVPSVPGTPSYMCTILPEPGVFDDTLPMVFPDNWPPEAFWTVAETKIPAVGTSGYALEAYVAGVEAAFTTPDPVDGQQISFARIRLRIDVPQAGTYTVTHPYGVETFNVTTPGRRAINVTRDIGVAAPGNFTGALNGAVGPFLHSVNGPYIEVNPETGASETFVGDPNLAEAVTGSPNGTNFVRISGPAGTIQTNLFNLTGKVYDNRAQTPVDAQRITYRRTSNGGSPSTRVEVFASSPNSSSLCFRETLALVPGTPATPCQTAMVGDNNGLFFGQHLLSTSSLPAVVVVTASNPAGTTRPTSVSSKLIDLVKIQTATYTWSNKTLVIEATSTDEVNVPDMVAAGFGRLSKSGTLQRLTVADLAQPPASVTVKSAAGGSDTEWVKVVGNAPNSGDNQPPVAVADTATTGFGVPITLNVLANDSDPDGNVPLSVTGLTQPATGQGTVALNGSTQVVYTPPAVVNAPIAATFTYMAQDSKGLASTPATVTVNVAPNRPPVANPDTGATLGVPLVINVLANDTDPEGNVPLGVASVTQPAAGRGTVTTDGTQVTYNPPATVTAAFTTTFTYVARDSFGALSTPATVTVQVSPKPAAETFTVTTASVQAKSGNRFVWDFAGTSSVVTGNTITVQVTTPTGLVTLGTTTVPATGRWRLTVNNSPVAPSANPTATIRSSQGSVRSVSVTTL
ncbi:Ig-like domain-containing protein [Pseudomonas sp. App30]|uniref:Ig-like domain-containing protein n=1 Tax=Pseudomonas sp. App30 TaxID=3068990 RepID=UPI003A80EBF0